MSKNPDFDAIKAATDIVEVIGRYVPLKREGKDWVGLCPFHEDKSPSLRVTQGKGLFRCMSCEAKGNVMQFVAKLEGIPIKEAALKLNGNIPGIHRGSELPEREQPLEPVPTVREPQAKPIEAEPIVVMTEPPVTIGQEPEPLPERMPQASDPNKPAEATLCCPSAGEEAALLNRVAAFYSKALFKNQAGLNYLKSRKLDQAAMLETFQVGYCDGSMRKALPKSGEVIEGLKALGILNEKGNEVFYGRVVVPVLDASGNVVSFYGRRLTEEKPKHLYQAGTLKGVFNSGCLKVHKTVLITEALFDAMSLWAAGWHNVISLYGNQGWIPEHETLLKENGITTVYLCLDNDQRSRDATAKLKARLESITGCNVTLPLAVYVVQWPEGVKDANEFFLSRGPANFETLLQAATPKDVTAPSSLLDATSRCLGKESIETRSDGFTATYGTRRYELYALEKPSQGRLKATIKALDSQGKFHIDTVDFYLSRSRKGFITEAARLYRESVETVEEDLNRILLAVEKHLVQKLENALPAPVTIPEGDRLEALRMGRNGDLVAEILRDFDKLGLVGETTNKLIGYLVMTSRKMDDPLALHILSGSGAGKSHLQDVILSLCPEEDLVKLTSLSDQALFYKGEDSLRHKVLAVEEEAGASGAGYAIRNLISSKKLTKEAAIRNPLTGKMETQISTVYGPTAVFQTTTNPKTDAETKSRFFLTSIDESVRQTLAILEAQRNSHTLEGRLRKKRRTEISARHWAFQRLLQPVMVVNPFEPLLRYGGDRLMMRRDNPKYLHLILVITFLHQFQRVTRHHPELGDYIETTLDDIAIANDLAGELFGQSLDELSRPSRTLLDMISQHVEKKAAAQQKPVADIEFNRRELREAFGWSEYQMRTHLNELAALEYIVPNGSRQGQLFHYKLIPQNESGRFAAGVKSVEQLREEALKIGLGNVTLHPIESSVTLASSEKSSLRAETKNFEQTSLNEKHEVKNVKTKPILEEKKPVVPSVTPASRASGEELIYVLHNPHDGHRNGHPNGIHPKGVAA